MPPLIRNIRFEQVTYHYPAAGAVARRPALDRVNFSILAGQVTALVGSSGSGKSTVVNLLCRLIDPSSGCISIDGISLTAIDLRAWRAIIAIAGQDVELIDGTIAENIAYALPQATSDEIGDAARRADAAQFIEALPDRYETRVGSRGLSLSGGQRQRIALARAFLRRPRILILDEATSAVDGASESLILSLLDRRDPDLTILVISHNARTLGYCDAVIRLD